MDRDKDSMSVEEIRDYLKYTFSDQPNFDLILSQGIDLWSNWLKYKNAQVTQDYYRGLASLKQFNRLVESNLSESPKEKPKSRVSSRDRYARDGVPNARTSHDGSN